ncbi:MAG: hypothetical protein U9N30_07410 [Campylobacterota bacterium]|nr:hypothetical protein [Campylobacterota bacterium]
MQAQYETRKLPKSTIIWIVLLVLAGVAYVLYNSLVQSSKIEDILRKNGYVNISNVNVYANHEVGNKEEKGVKFTVSFDDNKAQQHCKGFIIIINHSNRLLQDLDCK